MTTGADWLDQARRLLDAVRGPEPVRGAPVDAGADGHPDDCRWCPVCQTAAVLRGDRPEVTAALADVLTTAADALRQFAADRSSQQAAPDGPPADGLPADGPAASAPAGDAAKPSPVQRIDIA